MRASLFLLSASILATDVGADEPSRDAATIKSLIQQLGDSRYYVREAVNRP